ncbi:MAG: alpha-mannosidase, partial [Oscillospiraceae bacterium]
SMAKNKRYNREAEILYGKLETLAFMASFFAIDPPAKEIQKGWDCILLNQFHDILPGTAIEEVYKTTDEEYGKILTAGKQKLQTLTGLLAKAVATKPKAEKQNGVVVFNTMGYSRSDVVYVALPKGMEDLVCLRDAAGNTVPVQHMPNGQAAFYAEGIPPLGSKTYWCVRGSSAERPQHSLPVVENKYYRAVVESDLTLSSLWEKQTGRELVAKGKRANRLLCFEDRPMNWDNWDIDLYYRKKRYEATRVTPYRVVSCGSVMTILENTLVFSNSVVHQQAVFYHDMPRIDFVHKVQWRQHNLLLKACFDTDIYAPRASFEIQFGNVERETTNNNSWDTAKFETCAHKWADLSDHGCGLSLLNNCKYGHYIKDRRMELTLIKAGRYPNENADIGGHEYTYSLYPHPGGWRNADTVAQAYNLNVPAEAVFLEEAALGGGAGQKSWVQVNAPNCFIEGIKPAEDGNGFVLRVYENNNRQTKARFSFSVPLRSVQACNLLEETEYEIGLSQGEFEDVLKPYEIKSYRLLV